MKGPILHIGYVKTGTTWFQENFYPYIENTSYQKKNTFLEDIISSYDPNNHNSDKKDNLRKIICDENILNNIWLGSISTKEIALRLKKIFPDGQIVIFIRNQIDVVASAYSQYIKGGGTFRFKRFINQTKEISFYSKSTLLYEHFKFHEIISFYINVFGAENTHIYLYEDFFQNNKHFLDNYANKFNLTVDLENISYTKKNTSLRKGLYHLVKITNHFTRRNNFFKQYIFHIPFLYSLINDRIEILNRYKIFGKHITTQQLIRKKNLEFIEEYFKESNSILYNNLGIDLIKKYKYPM